MKRLATILAILFGTALLLMLIATPTDAKTIAKVGPVVGGAGPVTVDVWTDRAEGSIYNRGESIAVYFYANADCYVTIYDIDTDGRVNILFPEYPDDGFVYGGMTYRLPDYYRHGSLFVTGSRGIEYIQAVATTTPGAFRYRNYGGRYHLGINPIAGDPFEAMNSINGRIISHSHIVSTSTTWFFVEGRVWYPRYMCNSCHSGSVRVDPYRDACPRYSVHVAGGYDYWWNYSYYPTVSVHFSFGGPFWRFERRTHPVHRHVRYIDVAHGYHNYYCPKPPRRPYKHIPHTTTRTLVRRDRVKTYEPVRYGEIRYRKDTRDPRSRDYTTSSTRTTTSRTTTTRTSSATAPSTRTTTTTRTSRSSAPTTRSRETTISRNELDNNRSSLDSRSGYDRGTTSTRTRTDYNRTPAPQSATSAPSATRQETRSTTTRTTTSTRTVAPQPNTQRAPERSPATRTAPTRTQSQEIQTSRIPSAPKSQATPSRSASSSRSPGSDSRSRQQSSSSSSSRSSTRTR